MSTIVLLVMRSNDRLDVPGKLGCCQQFEPPHRVVLDDLELLGRERALLVDDLGRNPDFADVV